jgi:DNA-binding IclR family transcriptional regulator
MATNPPQRTVGSATNVCRILDCFTAFDPGSRRYRLGERVGRLAAAYGESTLGEIVRPTLERLRDTTGETAAVQVRAGDVRYCIVEVPSAQPIRLTLTEQAPYPVRRGAAGAVLRAFAPAWRDEHDEPAIYVPLFAASGALIAALGVHGLSFRMPDDDLPAIAAQLQAAGAELGRVIPAEVPLR